jgi:hypothetical protein
MTDQSAALLAAYRLGVQHGGQIEQSLFGSGSGGTSGSAPERQSPAGDQNGGLPLDDTRPDTKGEATGGRGHFAQGPVAWAVESGAAYPALCHTHCDALHVAARNRGSDVVPLYRQPQPTLTDEEREVLGRVADDASYRATRHTERVVRQLLERSTVAGSSK